MELKKIKIIKKLYRFEVRKRYQHIARFKVKQKNPADQIRAQIAKIFARPAEKGAVGKSPVQGIQAAPKSNAWVMIGAIALVLILLLVGGIYFYSQSAKAGQMYFTSRLVLSPQLNTTIEDGGVITAGDKKDNSSIGYIRLKYNTDGIKNFTINVKTYEIGIPSEVFILSSPMDKAQTTKYADFRSILKKEMAKKKISVNELDLEQLETIPKGAFLLIPHGRIPQELFGIESMIDLNKLMERGVNLVYIGLPFDKMILKNGLLVSTPENALKAAGVSFNEKENLLTQGLNLYQPLYVAKGTAGDANSVIYGSVSAIRRKNGMMILVPQTLDGGWKRDPEAAAKDIAKLLTETAWATPDNSEGIVYSKLSLDNETHVEDLFTNTFKGNVRYAKLDVTGKDVNGDDIGELRIVEIRKKAAGSWHIGGGFTVVPTEITNEEVPIILTLNEKTGGEKYLYVSITKNGGLVGERKLLKTVPINTQTELTDYLPINLDSGDYIASIEDEAENKYAQTFLHVVFVDIEKLYDKEERKVIRFGFEKEGAPVVIRNVEVTVKSKKGDNYGKYEFNDVSQVSVDVSKNVPGSDKLPYGDYIFRFKMGEIEKDVPVSYARASTIFEDPVFIVIGVLSILILGVGVYFARKEAVMYQLDVPDFPPISKTKISITTPEFLSIFTQVNTDYRWKYTPLNTTEIKNGFRKIMKEGRTVYISDYNVEYILGNLIKKGVVKESIGYYCPTSWGEESKRSAGYLCIFRKLRDIFVNNAVPFTQLGEQTECDTKMDMIGQEMHVHIFDKEEDGKRLETLIGNSLRTSQKGISMVIFKNEDDKREFQDVLSSSSSGPITLKLEVDAKSVLLLTIDEFEKMVLEMKG